MVAALVLAVAPLSAQQKPTLGPDDYDRFESLGSATLSADGRWMAVSIGRVSGENELRIHRSDVDSVVVVAYGARPTFSEDGAWLAYVIGVSEDEREAAEERDERVYNALGLLNLTSGEQERIDDVEAFSFSDGGAYLAIRRYKPEEKESDGCTTSRTWRRRC